MSRVFLFFAGLAIVLALLAGKAVRGCTGPGEVDRGIAPNLASAR